MARAGPEIERHEIVMFADFPHIIHKIHLLAIAFLPFVPVNKKFRKGDRNQFYQGQICKESR